MGFNSSLAFTVLDLYPDEFPGYSTCQELGVLVDWAVGLCGSARQRESDAGKAPAVRFSLTMMNKMLCLVA